MESESAAVRESASYGKACSGCSKAKCRCIVRGEGLSCERCHRLSKSCQPSATVRKRASAPRPVRRTTATTRLEDRLDALVNLLAAQAKSGAGNASRTPGQSDGIYVARSPDAAPAAWPESPASEATNPREQHHETLGLERCPDATPHTRPPHDSMLRECPLAEDDQCLETFRAHHLRAFPFLHIPPSTSAADVQREWPFLWLNIRASCCKPYARQQALELKVRETIAQKMLVDLERSLDLLLGLLTYLSWAEGKYRGKPLLSAYSSLATALLFDLRLDRSCREIPCRESNVSKAYSHPIKQVVAAVDRNNVERRAVLGCYVVTATIAWFLRMKPIGWTVHMEDCLSHLAQYPEVPGDCKLVATARLFRIMEEVHSVSTWRKVESTSSQPQFYVKGLRAMLDNVKDITPPQVLQDKMIRSYLCMAEALICELALHARQQQQPASVVDFERTNCFYTCLQALQGCVDNFLTFTPEEAFSHPMPMHLHFSRSTHILYRLCLLDDPACDRAAVLRTVDLLGAVEKCAALYAAVPAAVGLETGGGGGGDDDMFTRTAEVLRAMAPAWRRALEDSGALPGASAVSMNVIGQDDMMSTDLLTDWWFADLMFPVNEMV
ncbi:hypothetical protein JDV02_008263 [Purpureocillium takamizusanense]|uniref:Zn(2)-C6 fungal-type domain-containing protein n=1 Tax=Purpureocillium takamizusanense TaxID=2060973 RepID=A0A9Q8VF11_9HYPO|nr:uncharacterized protein JDV02_008263 [Purpureocillium takamizusanense]UNI22367.1 hypothetical protein JDV02_008263 [Purpureocillium takamizusanense]